MKSMQTKILDRIEEILTDDGNLEAIQKANFANTGTVYAMRDMTTYLEISYGFNDGYCTISFSGALVDASDLVDAPGTGLSYRYEVLQKAWRERAETHKVTWYHLDYGTDRLLDMLIVLTDLVSA